MSDPIPDFADQPRRGAVSQIATTLFVGIPMTIGLVVTLGFYCTYEFAKFAFSSKARTSSNIASEETFTASLANFAQIHGETPKIELPKTRTEAVEESSSVKSSL